MHDHRLAVFVTFAGLLVAPLRCQLEVSGIRPALAMFNDEGECGVGAVVPFADRLWVVTYAPHAPRGSSDKLYEITPDLVQIVRPESIGGTPADRLLHVETGQLLIGPYVIDGARSVRVIDAARMPGRLTGAARHLTDPAHRVYVATMEEGLYDVDLRTLEVRTLYADAQGDAGGTNPSAGRFAGLPGYHGKGLFSGQGRVVYANNGENSALARERPDVPSGVLAEWDGTDWHVVRRNQFTEVTGPGGLRGNADPAQDPIWSIGWDHRSLLLLVRDAHGWRTFRLPKGSHSYDGAHGWNTEWPRIREIGELELLMTMHGTFWAFPPEFGRTSTAGIRPRSNYLKVVGDFCRWRDRVVFGCDDTAKNEFLNKRRAKGALAGPGRSHSNLWFVAPKQLDALGPALGRGAVWLDDDVAAGEPSDPNLFTGYARRALFVRHTTPEAVRFAVEVDRDGRGAWQRVTTLEVPAGGHAWDAFEPWLDGIWIRIVPETAATRVSAVFQYAADDARGTVPDPMFAGLATVDDSTALGARLRVRDQRRGTLAVAASRADAAGSTASGFFELDAALHLTRRDEPTGHADTVRATRVPTGVVTVDAASVLYVDDDGRRWRLPKGDAAFDRDGPLGPARIDREVVTERDLFHAHGTFYELPAENAGGFAKVRPIASHRFRIDDYCSFRGLLVLSGLRADAVAGPHVVRTADGDAALWVGAIDDLWRLGKPRGHGGPWHRTPVEPGTWSDPYLMTGYDVKQLTLAHDRPDPVEFVVQCDVTGTGTWFELEPFVVPAGEELRTELPAALNAYWLRAAVRTACAATVQLEYR